MTNRLLRNWTPILSESDPLTARSWDAIHGIAEAIVQQNYGAARGPIYEEALLFSYLELAEPGGQWIDLAVERLNEAIEAAAPTTYCGLFGGLSGLGWTIDHLSQLLGGAESSQGGDSERDPDVNGDIDTLLLRELQRGRWTGPYDLISGLVGMGIYFLQRLPAEKASLGIELVTYQLDKNTERNGNQITWHTSPELLPAWQAARSPGGYYNFGVAHGVSGVLHFLSQVLESGVEREKSKRLIEGGVEWLIAQEQPPDAITRFATNSGESTDSSLAWCDGDLGIMGVLYDMANRAARDDWQQLATKIADSCLARPEDKTGVKDASLFRGHSGVAHIFNRAYHQTGDPRFRNASLHHLDRALSMRQAKGGVGGFFSVTKSDPEAAAVHEVRPAFLDGAIGIALTLLSALMPTEPVWDRMLLLSGSEFAHRI